MHSINLMHRDLKPSNILLDKEMNVKLGDIGTTKEMINIITNTFTGTIPYMAPEILK